MDSFITLVCLGLACFMGRLASGAQFNLYHMITNNWEDSKQHCVEVNRVLAKVDNENKQKRVENLRPYVQGDFWIGLRLKSGTQEFQWLDGTPAEYTNWAQGFPGYTAGLDCVRMHGNNFHWETFNCSESLNFLCGDENYKEAYTVSDSTKLKGIFMGIGVIGSILVLICLLLQLPCCRSSVTDKIAHIGFGTKEPDQKTLFT